MKTHETSKSNPWSIEVMPYGVHYSARFQRRVSVLWAGRVLVFSFAASVVWLLAIPMSVFPTASFLMLYLAVLSGLLLLFFGILLAWNIWGEERYTLTEMAVIRQHHYGLWTTPEKAFPTDQEWLFSFEAANPKSEDGFVCFWKEDSYGVPRLVARTAVPVPLVAYETLLVSFLREYQGDRPLPPEARWN